MAVWGFFMLCDSSQTMIRGRQSPQYAEPKNLLAVV